jgi:penicillin-binding protein 1A
VWGGGVSMVVVGYDERKKVTIVNCGGPKVEVGAEGIKWTGQSSTPLLLKRGDLVYLKIQKQGSTLVGYLEQKPQLQGALFSMDTLTGVVLGMEGGYDHDQSEFNRAIQAQRQPGSAFKPIIFSAAIEKGFTPASIIVDAPIVYDSAQGKWKPANYEEKFYGDTTFRNALVKSRNIPTIKIVQAIEVPYLIQFAKRIGLNSNFSPDLSIALGSGTVNLADLVKTYAVFPRLGKQIEPIFYKTIKDHNDKILDETRAIPPINLDRVMGQIKNTPAPISFPLPSEPYQVMDPRTAYIATHLMKDVVNYGTGTDAKQLGRPVAGKTGTTNDYQDAWFVAFTPQVVTGVWVGYDNSRSIGSGGTGAHAALPIWLDFMKSAVTRYPVQDFAIPNGIDFITVDSQTGKRVKSGSSGAILEAFISGTEPDFSQNTDTTQSGNDSNTETDGQNNPGSEKKGTTGTSKTNNSSNQSDFLKGDIN